MFDWLRYTVIVAVLVLALLAYLDFRAKREPSRVTQIVLITSAVIVAVQTVIAYVQLGRGHETSESATFIGYAATNLILLPTAAYVARIEKSRWSAAAIAVVGLIVAVLEVRMQQLWTR